MNQDNHKHPPVSDEWLFRTYPDYWERRKRTFLNQMAKPFRLRSIWVQLGFFLVVLILWPIPAVNPIKLLVVLFHETSHVLASVSTGGEIYGVAIDPQGAGVSIGRGGNEFFIVAAGYLGCLIFGALIYSLSAVWEPGDVWIVLSVLCCVSPWFQWLNMFTAFFAISTIGVMILGFYFLHDEMKKFFLRLIATTCCLYPLIDVVYEYHHRNTGALSFQDCEVYSDVFRLSLLTGISEGWIVSSWLIVGFIEVVTLITWASRKDASMAVKLTLFSQWRDKRLREYKKYDPNDPSTISRFKLR